jgi:alanyl-tRNA synthetase
MKTDDIRQAYLDFFIERDHRHVPSSPLIPHGDPTLMFTSAGMVQFKDFYSGAIDPLPYTRSVTCQKCFRAGGKASDLENVGKTLRHHTFFEMLGNFSFGDYFKREACAWALEFSRDVMNLDMDKVWVSYHHDDEEAAAIWRDELGFPSDRIVPMGDKDNWWGPAGDTGACGPCSEMHYDLGPEFGTGPEAKVGGDSDRYLEYWNMVFPQFDHQLDGSRPELKNRGIDTGLGLARLALIKQGASSAYTIDAMWPITKAVADTVGVSDYAASDHDTQMAVNVIADHIRALTFVMSEGVAIGNTDRGYVLKRILRRAARFGRKLGKHDPFIHMLVPAVVETMGPQYPEIKEKPGFIAESIRADEENFHRTMQGGMELLEGELKQLKSSGAKVFPGDVAYRLWETYGFPREDTEEIALDEGLELDEAAYFEAEKRHKSASMSIQALGADDVQDELFQSLLSQHGATKFVGYDTLESAGSVLAIINDDLLVQTADEATGDLIFVLEETPFYAESGGQVGDRGMLKGTAGEGVFKVTNTTKTKGGLYLHHGQVIEGGFKVGEICKTAVTPTLRGETERNHSATHLMQGALKRVLGQHVTQSGSLVNEYGLRFDFTHLKALSETELREIEEAVNEQIRANSAVEIKTYPAKEATEIPGVIAPFDEKYGDDVRVVKMGVPGAEDEEASLAWDIEFCGGTHVKQTGEIGIFLIKHESSISQGVRRIEALTGQLAESYLMLTRDTYRNLTRTLSVDGAQLHDTVVGLMNDKRQLERQVAEMKKQLALAGGSGGGSANEAAGEDLSNGIHLITRKFDDLAAGELRGISVEMAKKAGKEKLALVLASSHDGKASLLVSVSDAVSKEFPAGKVVKELAEVVGGRGGGKPDFAQAGGKHPEKIDDALALAPKLFGG